MDTRFWTVPCLRRPAACFLRWIALSLLAAICTLGQSVSAAPNGQVFVCTCTLPTCGNGATPGTQNQVYHGVPGLSLDRMFAPNKTGDEKTGWECVLVADYHPPTTRPKTVTATPVKVAEAEKKAAAPSDPKTVFSCVCGKPRCGGAGLMPGAQNDRHESLSPGLIAARFQPGSPSGWQCQNGLGEPFSIADAAPVLNPNLRYACTCTQPTCGGKDGIVEGERGQKHSGITASRVGPKYGPERSGETATGWTCKSEGPAPKFSCTCGRDLCGGKDGILEGERGQVHSGVSLLRLQSGYGPERQGDAATGWTCTQETAQSVATAPAPSPIAASAGGLDPGYVCRCEGALGCGAGGAPFGKKGEVRNNVPASLINDRYQSDKPGGWVCSVAAGTVPRTIQGLPDPGYVCRCEGLLGCGAGGAPFGKKNEVRTGVPAIHITQLYQSDVPGGWVCSTQ